MTTGNLPAASGSRPSGIFPSAHPDRLDKEEELADWRAGRNAVHQLAALTIGARVAVADA
jgi:hypothetical protein